MEEYIIKSISEYISTIIKIIEKEDGNAWFRGHGIASYQLTPSVLREIVPLCDARGNYLTGNEVLRSSGQQMTGINPERLLHEFKRRAIHLIDEKPSNDFEWLFIMQHYGIRTRLLDWTTNALVALYFAIETETQDLDSHESDTQENNDITVENISSDRAAAIFVMNPNKFNKLSTTCNYPVDISNNYDDWKHYVRPTESEGALLPICVLAPHSSSRIRAQSGVFTLHGSLTKPLESYEPINKILHKIYIPFEFKAKMKKDLCLLGMTKSFIYQDLDSLSFDIMRDEQNRFYNERQKYLRSLNK